MSARKAFPVVVAAPSGTGKTTICRRIVSGDPEIEFSVSHTTRPQRPGEVDGVDYHFVSEAEFEREVEAGAFLEWAIYNGNRYGTHREAIERPLGQGRDVLLEIEVQGAKQVRERRPDARFIFLVPPSLETLRARLAKRGTDGPDQIARRLEVARSELAAIEAFDYAVLNDDLDRCVADVRAILAAERRGDPAALRERFAPARVAQRLGRGG